MFNLLSKLEQFFRLSVIRPAAVLFHEAIISKVRSIEGLCIAHRAFIESVSRGCMLTSEYGIVVDSLWGVLDTCASYANCQAQLQDRTVDLDKSYATDYKPNDVLSNLEDSEDGLEKEIDVICSRFNRKHGQFTSLLTAQSIVYNGHPEATVLLLHLRKFT